MIAAIGKIDGESGSKILDAKGLIISSGFIDAHAHSENSIRNHPNALHKISQGITMEITGHCGDSYYPSRNPSENSYSSLSAYQEMRGEDYAVCNRVVL